MGGKGAGEKRIKEKGKGEEEMWGEKGGGEGEGKERGVTNIITYTLNQTF